MKKLLLLDEQGRSTILKNGYAKETRKYDARGNVIEEAYSGIDGQPTLYKEGYAKGIFKYDDRGDVVEEAYFDVDGKEVVLSK